MLSFIMIITEALKLKASQKVKIRTNHNLTKHDKHIPVGHLLSYLL